MNEAEKAWFGMTDRKMAVYSRKSKFTGKGESVENQIELCRRYIEDYCPKVLEIIVFEDEGFSGSNTNRPEFQKMLEACRNREVSGVVCYRLDRISRNIGDFAKLIDELNTLGISFISIKEQFDTSLPMGRAMMYIASVFSQLERETIAERIRDNMLELAKTGRWLGGTTPTGYRSEEIVNTEGKIRRAYKLSIIEDEARLVRLIFDKFIELNSLTKVESYLLKNGITTKFGNKFTRFAVKNIITNPVYMIADINAYEFFDKLEIEIYSERDDFDGSLGIMAYNKTIQKKGQTHKIRELPQWIIAVGKHEGLVKSEIWIKANEKILRNKSKSYRKPRNGAALLSGVLYCSCGAYMRPKQRINSAGEIRYSYICETKEKTHGSSCNNRNVNGNHLDDIIWKEIIKLPYDREFFISRLVKLRDDGTEGMEKTEISIDGELEMLEKKIKETEKNINSLITALTRAPKETEQYIFEEIKNLHSEKEEIIRRITDLERKKKEADNVMPEMAEDINQLWRNAARFMSVEQKRSAVRSCITRIVYDEEGVHVYLCSSDE